MKEHINPRVIEWSREKAEKLDQKLRAALKAAGDYDAAQKQVDEINTRLSALSVVPQELRTADTQARINQLKVDIGGAVKKRTLIAERQVKVVQEGELLQLIEYGVVVIGKHNESNNKDPFVSFPSDPEWHFLEVSKALRKNHPVPEARKQEYALELQPVNSKFIQKIHRVHDLPVSTP